MINQPDGVLGAVLASESVEGARAMINGPGGCRSRMMIVLRDLIPYYTGEANECWRSKFFSRQSSLPCTYLNSNDMVVGSGKKIAEAVDSVLGIVDDQVVLLDTLGASLQVTDNAAVLEGRDRVIHPSNLLSSVSFGCGYDITMRTIAERLAKDTDKVPGRVNIIGFSIMDSGWFYAKAAIEEMVLAAGAGEVRFLGCKCDRETVEELGSAELNILIHPEYGKETAEYLEGRFGTATLVPSMGSPVGYPSMASFVREVAGFFGADPSGYLEGLQSEKSAVNGILTNNDRIINQLRGGGLSIKGIASDVLPLAVWLYNHLNLVPESVVLTEPGETVHTENLRRFLDDIGCPYALGNGDASLCRVRLTDGMEAAYGMGEDDNNVFVPISMPYTVRAQLLDRSIVGKHGCRFVLDEIINGLGVFNCGQPTMADMRRSNS